MISDRNLFVKQDSTFKKLLKQKMKTMNSKTRKTICIELICISILSVLPLGGSSVYIESEAQRNHVRGKYLNEPTSFSVPIEDVIDYHEESVHYRHKRSAQGKKGFPSIS